MIFCSCGFNRSVVPTPLTESCLLFFARLSRFSAPKLKKSPRTPRTGRAGRFLELPPSVPEFPPDKSRSAFLTERECDRSNFSALRNCAESGRFPGDSPAFREINRSEGTAEDGGIQSAAILNSRTLYTSKGAVLSNRESKANTMSHREGTKKAPARGTMRNPWVQADFPESFKSCRGHQLSAANLALHFTSPDFNPLAPDSTRRPCDRLSRRGPIRPRRSARSIPVARRSAPDATPAGRAPRQFARG